MGQLKGLLPYAVAAGLALAAAPVSAVTVVSCKDKDGSTFFADRCPPGTTRLGEKEVRSGPRRDTGAELAEVAKAHPVVLYSVADCDACDLVRQLLKGRHVPYAEKDVGSDQIENQQALKAIGNGSIIVPTVAIGAQTFTGYSRVALDLGLDEAGYPPRATAAEPATAPAAREEGEAATTADETAAN
jgi:glutaredoxin